MQGASQKSILAVVYSDGLAADRFLSDLAYSLRSAGLSVAGLVQQNEFVRDRAKCDMKVEELFSRTVLQLSEDRGPAARGCRLDRSILTEAAGLLAAALDKKPDLLVLNKFGKVEAEGAGLRDVLISAAGSGIPTIVGVPFRNLDQWRSFVGGLADECGVDNAPVHQWLSAWKIVPEDENPFRASPASINASTGHADRA